MPDRDQDDDLTRAIALSLADSNRVFQQGESSGSHSNDDDDEARFQADLQRAIAASQAQPAPPRPASPATSVTSSTDPSSPSPPASTPPLKTSSTSTTSTPATYSTTTFLTERTHLEQERLARLKRSREQNSQSEEVRPVKRKTPSVSPEDQGTVNRQGWLLSGGVRQTANRFAYPGRNGEDGNSVWRLSEIIGDKSDIELAILSSYATQPSWIYEFFRPGTPVVLVAQPSTQESSQPTVKQILPHWIRVTPAFRGAGYGVMHIKLILLFYKTGRLRIAIPTANFVPCDWRDIENSVFVQDVPRRKSLIPHDPQATDFAATLEGVLRALNVDLGLQGHMQNDHPKIPLSNIRPGSLRRQWDFSKVTVKLVASLNGKHEGWPSVIKVGHVALMKAVRDIANITGKKGRVGSIECQGSSIGNYSTKWLNEFFGSCMGENPELWLDEPKSRRDKLPFPNIKILFPTLNYVRQSALGEQGGGTMFCRRNQWYAPKFPRELFYQARSRRGKILMHSKMIIAIFSDSNNAGASGSTRADGSVDSLDKDGDYSQDVVGWAYVGSHNFTPSAWGTLSGSAFTPVLNISNYELGVVFPLYSEGDANEASCYERPPVEYSRTDSAWIQEDSDHFKQ